MAFVCDSEFSRIGDRSVVEGYYRAWAAYCGYCWKVCALPQHTFPTVPGAGVGGDLRSSLRDKFHNIKEAHHFPLVCHLLTFLLALPHFLCLCAWNSLPPWGFPSCVHHILSGCLHSAVVQEWVLRQGVSSMFAAAQAYRCGADGSHRVQFGMQMLVMP